MFKRMYNVCDKRVTILSTTTIHFNQQPGDCYININTGVLKEYPSPSSSL